VRASIPLWRAAQRGSLEARLYLAALIILVAGLIDAAIIYATAPAPDSAVQMYGMANSPQYMQQLQQIGGTAEVVLAQFHQWFDSLWHGKPLAYTVAVLCAVAAVACFLAGHFVFFDAPSDPIDRPES
jgi:ABC-type dipeptide/oligopeptide/nickel transport system permease component